MDADYRKILFERCHDWVDEKRREGAAWDSIETLCGLPEQAEALLRQLCAEKGLPDDILLEHWKAYVQAERKRASAVVLVAVFERNIEQREKLRSFLRRYSIRREVDLERIWFEDDQAAEKLQKYAVGFHIALVSLDDPDAYEIGTQIYNHNPDCLICYYKRESCPLRPLLNSRPYEFYTWMQGEEGFFQVLDRMIYRAANTGCNFCYDTKKCLYCYPTDNILYFQSNLKYVFIRTVLGNDANLYAKLTNIETILRTQAQGIQFLRIHKSFIVNRKYVRSIDKQHHTVQMTNGEEIPISEAHYQAVLKSLKMR